MLPRVKEGRGVSGGLSQRVMAEPVRSIVSNRARVSRRADLEASMHA